MPAKRTGSSQQSLDRGQIQILAGVVAYERRHDSERLVRCLLEGKGRMRWVLRQKMADEKSGSSEQVCRNRVSPPPPPRFVHSVHTGDTVDAMDLRERKGRLNEIVEPLSSEKHVR